MFGSRLQAPVPVVLLAVLFGVGSDAMAQSSVPKREIPPTVLAELGVVQNHFEIALAADCSSKRCFSTGCTYVDHAVADRPRSRSLPGLSLDPGPGSVPTQAFLTRARCGFSFEPTVKGDDAQALARRLQTKVSQGWTSVSVSARELQPLPAYLQTPPEVEVEPTDVPEPVEDSPVEPEPFSLGTAVHELWTSLLPHAFWMVGMVLFTFVATSLIWAWRRVGRDSFEERAMLAELERGEGEPPEVEAEDTEEGGVSEPEGSTEAEFVHEQEAAWNERLAAFDLDDPDQELQALIRELLRSGDKALLAAAVLRFPERFLSAFPTGGDLAMAKLDLADFLKNADTAELPAEADFFRSLNRHALSATLASQSDAQTVRSLREDFGAAGLVALIQSLPARAGALLFALGPADEQQEMVRLLSPNQIVAMAEQLLRSNRMGDAEAAYVFEVLRTDPEQGVLPAPPAADEVSDRGAAFDAAAALSVLLPGLNPSQRATLFARAIERFRGSLPSWHREIFTADMLFQLSQEARTDLLLSVDATTLAAWMSLLDKATSARLQEGFPNALRASVDSVVFSSRSQQLALAERGRRALARGFQQQLERARIPFEDIVAPDVVGEA